jgi:putative membrane protein
VVAPPTLRDAISLRDGGWYRLHPLTPVLQGGVVVAGLVGFALAALWESVFLRIISIALGIDSEEAPESEFIFSVINSITTFGLLIIFIALATGFWLWLQWRVHLVRMDDDVIEVKKGIIFRSSRRTRRDRVNTVGVRRPLIPRMLGLAKLDIQAAGSESNMVLAYLPNDIAHAVRQEILEPRDDSVAENLQPLVARREVEVPLFRYLASLVVSLETVLLGFALVAVISAAVISGELLSWLGVILALFIFVVYLAGKFFRMGSFIIDQVEGDIRVSLGLLSTSVETIPPERIHALEISQPWPWRFFGWWRVDANLASNPGSQVSKAPSHTMIIPVATEKEMLRVVALCLPAMNSPEKLELIDSSLAQAHTDWVSSHPSLTHTIGSPDRAKYRIPLSARVNGAAVVQETLLLRTGQWVKRLSLVPLARVQSLAIGFGPWHDVFNLAAVNVHSVSGPVATGAPGFDAVELQQWWSELTEQAIMAISLYRPKQRTRKPAQGAQ